MRIIIPSMGRCGSSYIAWQIAHAFDQQVIYAQDYKNAPAGQIIKTHGFYAGMEPDDKFIFVAGEVGHIYASLFEMSMAEYPASMTILDHLAVHFEHMGVNVQNQLAFWQTLTYDPIKAWVNLINQDGLQLKTQWASWTTALPRAFVPHFMVILYEVFLKQPEVFEKSLKLFLHTDVDLVVKLPDTNASDLPNPIQKSVINTYGSLTWPNNQRS